MEKQITMKQLLDTQIHNLNSRAAQYRHRMRALEADEASSDGTLKRGEHLERSLVRLDAKCEALENWALAMQRDMNDMTNEQLRQKIWIDANFEVAA